MYRAIGLAFAAAALLLAAGQAQAAGAAACAAYAKEAVAKAKAVRDFGCGYDLNDPRWTTDRKSHLRWCRATQIAKVAEEMAERRGQMKLCKSCRAYANLAATAAADNVRLKCEFSGPRWNVSAGAHFSWCMALRRHEGSPGADDAASGKSLRLDTEVTIHGETGERILGIANCKTRGSNRS